MICGLPAFKDSPYNKGLASMHVAAGKNVFDGCHIIIACPDVSARIQLDAKFPDKAFSFGAQKSQSKYDQVRVYLEFAGRNFFYCRAAVLVFFKHYLYAGKFLDPVVFAQKPLCQNGPAALAAFFVAG